MPLLSIRPSKTRAIVPQQAFTLMELMLTLSISFSLVMLAVPSFGALLAKTHVMTTTSELQTALYLARTYAIANQTHVIVCAALDASMTSCVDRPRRNSNWRHGWLVYADKNRNKTLDSQDFIVSVGENQKELAIVFNQNGLLRFSLMDTREVPGFMFATPIQKPRAICGYSIQVACVLVQRWAHIGEKSAYQAAFPSTSHQQIENFDIW